MNAPVDTVATTPLREIADLPGPRGVPFLGNALQLSKPRIHEDIERLAKIHGPCFRIRIGPRQILVIADHKDIAAVMRARPETFRRPLRSYEIGQEMGFDPGVFVAEGEAWRNQRRMVMASFAPGHVKTYFPALLKVAQRLQRRWQAAAAQGAAISLQEDLMRFTVDAVAGLAFGSEVNTLESDDDVIQRHLDKIFPALFRRILAILPYWRYVRLPADRELDRSVIVIKQAIQGFIAQARARLQADPARREQPASLLEAMLVAADEGGSAVNDRDVAGNVLTMLLAGEDTTANTLAWMIYLLHRNPAPLQRAQEEVRRLAGDCAALTPEHLGRLDYLEACIHETMRLKPVAPFIPFEALCDTAIGDLRVPEGTLVWCVLRHDTMDPQHFPNPERFEPERWLVGGGAEQASAAATSAKRMGMPFGGGPRICPGRYLAMLEIKLAMATMLGSFDIQSVDTPDGGEARELMAFTMSPVGLTMRLHNA